MGFSKISLAGYTCMGFGALIFHYMIVIHRHFWLRFASEGGLIETVQAGFFLLSGAIFAVVAFMNRNIWRRLLLLFSAFTMAIVVGEEISWGQHIFGFESPDWFETANYQGETNFHNLVANAFSQVKYFLAFAGAVIIFSARFSNRDKLFGILLPSIPLAFGLLIVISYRNWLLPSPLTAVDKIDILGKISYKYSLLVFLLVYVSFRFSREKITNDGGDSKRLVFIAVSTIALILSYEYAAYVRVYAFSEIGEYILSLICLVYSVELLTAQLASKTESIGSTIIDKEARGWLPVCSVMTVCSIILVPVGYLIDPISA